MFEIVVTKEDIEQIEKHMDEFTKWVTNKFTSIGACALMLQSVLDGIDKAKTALEEEDN